MSTPQRAALLAEAEAVSARMLALIDADELEQAEAADRRRRQLLMQAFGEPVPPDELESILEQVERLHEMDRCIAERVALARRRLARDAEQGALRRRAAVAYGT